MSPFNDSSALGARGFPLRQRFVLTLPALIAIGALAVASTAHAQMSSVKTVFIIVLSDQPWSAVKDSSSAPYINGTLLPAASSATNYFSPIGGGVVEGNYLWLEAGTNFGVFSDAPPSDNHQSTTSHLVTQLANAGVSWKTYQEGIDGSKCPLNSQGLYNTWSNPFIYFDDVTGNLNAASPNCLAHVRPFSEFAADLNSNTVARYNFIRPNVCGAMHRACPSATSPADRIRLGDTWLSLEVPKILASAAYTNGGAILVTWDQAASNVPVGMILLSPFARHGYTNSVRYTHGSTLRTIQEIFGLTSFLGDAANQTAMDDFFLFPSQGNAGVTLAWNPSPGAASYSIKRATTDGGPYTTVATGVTTPSYTDRGLTSGVTYFYVVSAKNESGESAPSVQVAATPLLAPPPPTNLTVKQTP